MSKSSNASVLHAKRICQVIKLKPESTSAYIEIHANAWPSVLATLQKVNIIDYSIHHFAPLNLLIAHFKYVGSDFDADMKKIAEDPETRRWWQITDGMQESFEVGAEGSGKDVPWWTDLPEVFRFDGSLPQGSS